MTTRSHHLTLFFCLTLFLLACKKEGPPGPAGANGANGKDGKDGNANVVTGTINITNANYKLDYWSYQTGPGSASAVTAKMALVSLPAITDDIFQHGTVLLYVKMPSVFGSAPSAWAAVPWTISSFYTGYLISIQYTYETGKLRVYYMYQPTDAQPTVAVPSISTATVPTFDFKYVIIAGKPNGRVATVDYSNYEAVKAFYHLPD